jgi:hypothetical protein
MLPDEERTSDKLLRWGETSVVLCVTVIVLLTFTYGLFWLVFCDPQTRSSRLTVIVKALNDNWKVGLVLAVPLFYRTIRVFLERVEEFGGMKAPRRQPPIGEKGDEIRQSELTKLPSEEVSGTEGNQK